MAVPSTFMLEAFSPLALVGSQAIHFLTPVFGMFVNPTEFKRLADLVERRDILEQMICRLEKALDEGRFLDGLATITILKPSDSPKNTYFYLFAISLLLLFVIYIKRESIFKIKKESQMTRIEKKIQLRNH